MPTPPPVTPPAAPAKSAEHSAIISCLSRIRRRLWSVRLIERLVIALQWSAGVSLFLTGAYLLRNRLPWENLPWTALLLTLTPMAAATYLFYHAPRFASLGLSKTLVRLAAVLTALLSLAMLALLVWPARLIIEVWMVPAGTIIAFALLAVATVRLISFRAAAIYVDLQVGLHERVSTALEMLETPVKSALETPFRTPVITSALGACQQVQSAKVGYARLHSRNYALAALIAVVAAGVTLIPPMPARAVSVRKPNTIVVKKAQDLHELLKELEEKQPPNDKTSQTALKPLQNAVTKLQDGKMSQIESNAVLNEAKAELKREQEQMAASDKVADAMKSMTQTKDFAKAAEGMKNAETQKGDGTSAAAEQQKAAASAMKAAAQAMADKMAAGQMSASEKKELADQLQAAADKAAGDPQLQKSLQNAADAARNGDSQQMAANMQQAGQRMGEQSAANQASQGAINRAMAEIDKMQGGGQGSQSTVAQGGQDGRGGQNAQNGQSGQSGQGGQEGQDGEQGGKNGSQANSNGGQSGDGEGTGSSPPGGKAPGGLADSGNGSTMMEMGGGPDRIQGQPLGGKGTFVRIYDARASETSGNQEKVGSFINPLKGPAVGTVEVFGQADRNDSSIKTYQDVLPEARQQAMDDLTRQEYPPQYQEMVRQFYNDAPKSGAPKK